MVPATCRLGRPALAAGLLLVLAVTGAWAQDAGQPKLEGTVADIEACLAQEKDQPRACIGRLSNLCQEAPEGSTTPGIASCYDQETALWDRLLNSRYATLIERMRADTDEPSMASAIDSLRDAQRKWIAFRDAECARLYDYWSAGTIRSVVEASCQTTLTAERAIEIDPSPEN